MFLRWKILTALVAAILGAIVARDLVLCRRVLVEVPVPADWRDWPVTPARAGFTLAGDRSPCVGHGLQCGLADSELRDPAVCPRCGISLDRWFGRRGIYGHPAQIAIRARDDHAFVVTGTDAPGRGDEEVVLAFERRDGWLRPALRERPAEAAALVAALVSLLIGGLVARGRLRRAAELLDPALFRPGTVTGGRLELDGDPEAYVVTGVARAGRVLVREHPRGAGDYRTAHAVPAADVLPIDPAAVRGMADLRAAGALRLALGLAIVCSTIAGVEAAGTWVTRSHILDFD